MICARLAQPLGLPRPQARFVPGRADRGDLVLIHHVADQPDEGELLAAGVDIAGEPSLFGPDQAALGRLAQELADPASLVGELLVAFLVDNDDAGNDRNWLELSLAGRRSSGSSRSTRVCAARPRPPGAGSRKLRRATQPAPAGRAARLPAAVDRPHQPAGHAARRGRRAGHRRRARRRYDRFVALAGLALRTLDLADVDPAHARRCWRLLTGRLELLEAERDAYLMVLSGASP